MPFHDTGGIGVSLHAPRLLTCLAMSSLPATRHPPRVARVLRKYWIQGALSDILEEHRW